MKIKFLLVALLAFFPAVGRGHDFWLEPSAHTIRPGQSVKFTLRVGENFMGDAVPRMPGHLKSFKALYGKRELVIGGSPNKTPAGEAAFDRTGFAVVGYDSNATMVEMEQAKFAQYVREEGLQARVAPMALSKKGKVRDSFSRQAKTIISVGAKEVRDRRIGMPLELLALAELHAAARAKKMPLRLYFRNKPLTDTLVVAMHRRNPARKLFAKTDSRGEVVLPLDQSGLWLIKAVHVIPAGNKRVADIESFWASTTLDLHP